MHRLKLLGGATVTADGVALAGRGVQRRRLGVLASLAMARARTLPRESIAVMLWPEADSSGARHHLSDSVYRINQTVGGSAIATAGEELTLDLTLLSCDAVEFREAVEQRDWQRAIDLYAGPFLAGFFLSDTPDFERWVDTQRHACARDYLVALEALAVQASESGRLRDAAELWRRAATEDPLSSRIAVHLMRALDASGEREAALRHAHVHAQLVRQELGAPSPREVAQLADSLRNGGAGETYAPPLPPAPSRLPREDVRAVASAHETIPLDEPLATEPPSSASQSVSGVSPAAPAAIPTAGGTPVWWRAPAMAALGVGLVAIVAVPAMRSRLPLVGGTENARVESLPASAIAVLPFANLSGDDTYEYVSDGLTEELIGTLGEVPGLRVLSRSSSFALKGNVGDVREVGRRLGVDVVMEGSVRRSGDRLRVTAHLVDVRDGFDRWSDRFDRPATDILAIQQEIARAIVDDLSPRLGTEASDGDVMSVSGAPTAARSTQDGGGPAPVAAGGGAAAHRMAEPLGGGQRAGAPRGARGADASLGRAHPADAPGAYDLYLKGRYEWHKRTERGLRAAVEHFTAATREAPRYALAFAGLADAQAVLGFYDYIPPRVAFPAARAAAERALALDSTIGAAHATIAYVALYYEWEFERAEREFQRAIALSPSYSTAHQWYGNFLTSRGRFDEAMREMRVAQELDPLSLIANAALGWVYFHAGRFDEAVPQLRTTLDLSASFEPAWRWLGQAEGERGKLREALSALRTADSLAGGSALSRASLARALALGGERDSARTILAALERDATRRYAPSYEIALVHAALGERAQTLHWLDRAVRERSHSVVFLDVEHALAPWRADARFRALVARVEGGR